jgi:hypothetical protein
MFSPNELNSKYGRQCRERQAFWDEIGVPRKQRMKFAQWLGHESAIELWKSNQDEDDFRLLQACYKDYKKEKEEMANIKLGDLPKGVTTTNVSWQVFVDSCYGITPEMRGFKSNTKEEETMDNNYEQRHYLENRLQSAHREHNSGLESHFNIWGGKPKTLNEAVELIKAGKFEVNQKNLDGYNHMAGGCFDDEEKSEASFDNYSFVEVLKFDVPQPDKVGYKAAEKLLDKAYTDAKDQIKVLDVEAGLKALKDFESATFH